MKFLDSLFSRSPDWDVNKIPGRRTKYLHEYGCILTPSAEQMYPVSVWAPPLELSKGPESDSYPEPYEFTKRELVAACRQGMKLHGSGERYPRPWRHKNSNEVTNYVAFPILPGQRLWTGGEPGRYRIVYNKIDGSFYRIIMHLYTTPLAEREIPVVGSGWPGDMSGSENTHQPGHIRSPSLPHARLIKSPPTEAMNQWPNQAGRRGSRYA